LPGGVLNLYCCKLVMSLKKSRFETVIFKKKMKLQNAFLLYFILLLTFQIGFAQEKPKLVLIDEFAAVKCDEIRSRIDNLLKELSNAPNSKAYVLIRGEKKRPITKHTQKLLLEAYIDIRQFDKNRIIFLQQKDEESVKIEFWITSEDTDISKFKAEDWGYKLPLNIKPFIIYSKSWVGEVCPNIYSLKFYSSLLLANPNSKGHLVIYENSIKDYYQTKRKIVKELVNENDVPRNQLKFFFLKNNKPNTEFWFVSLNTK